MSDVAFSKRDPEEHEADKEEIVTLCSNWELSAFDEVDWTKIRDMPVREILDKRRAAAATSQECQALKCPDFVKHVNVLAMFMVTNAYVVQFGMRHNEWLIKENIASLQQLMSDQNLQLLPDYEQRINVLKDLGFIDDNSRVELKGKVACEVRRTSALI